MKINSLRMKVALGYLAGAVSVLSYSVFATESEVIAEVSKPSAGIHCPVYDNKVGEKFTCDHVDDGGDVVKSTTFLVALGSNGNLIPVSADGAVEAVEVTSETIPAVTVDDNSTDSIVSDPVVSVDEPSNDASISASDISEPRHTGEESIVKEKEVAKSSWFPSFTVAYEQANTAVSNYYDKLFPSEVVEEEEPTPVAVPVVKPTVVEPEPVDQEPVELSNWVSYSTDLYDMDPVDNFQNEVHWLAMNMVFEARDQEDIGMDAVADVTMKRLDIQIRGDETVYDIVTDPAEFEWYGDAVPDLLTRDELPIFVRALATAERLISSYAAGTWSPSLASEECPEGATHYHTIDITPNWQHSMDLDCGIIGRHHFWYGK
jgi:hypothetical protein